MAKIRALSWKPEDIQQQYFDEEGELDTEKLQGVTLEEIRDEGKTTTSVPWKKFQYLPGVQHRVDGKAIVINIKAADLRSIYKNTTPRAIISGWERVENVKTRSNLTSDDTRYK